MDIHDGGRVHVALFWDIHHGEEIWSNMAGCQNKHNLLKLTSGKKEPGRTKQRLVMVSDTNELEVKDEQPEVHTGISVPFSN